MVAMPATRPANKLPQRLQALRPATTLNEDACWQAALDRRPSADGMFYVAVKTTGVYCRPTCRSRTPLRKNVVFFASADEAEAAGFRACKRCRPRDTVRAEVALVQRICRRLEQAEGAPPTLRALAREFSLSPFHLQRVFKKATGVSPRQYAEARRTERLKRRLREGDGVAAAVYGAGFGSGSRVYERRSDRLGMTPASYGKGGAGMRINYTIGSCDFGRILVAATERGVSAVAFGDRDAALERHLVREYPAAEIARDDASMKAWLDGVLRTVAGDASQPHLPLDIRATAFRMRVWEALRRIPRGETRSYAEVAAAVGAPRAVRAVGSACKANPVPLIVPCHRVVKSDGELGQYSMGGPKRKRELLEMERVGR